MGKDTKKFSIFNKFDQGNKKLKKLIKEIIN